MNGALSLIIICGLLSGPAVAQTYKVGVELQPYKPISMIEAGEYQGYGRDLLDAFAAHEGHQFIYVPLPVRRLLKDFLAAKVDFKFPDDPQWNGDQKRGYRIYYSQAAATYIDGVLVRPEHLGKGVERIRVLGTQRGFTPWPYIPQIESGQMTVNLSNQVSPLLRMAINGRVDAIYVNPLVARSVLQAEQLPADALVFDPSLPHADGHYALSSLQHPEVIAEFDAFLRDNPTLVRRLKDKYALD
ncbi:substrate-binding periplasmic protein [Pseudomonas borbori]